MGILELALIGAGLSMDAFAASVCKGLSMKKIDVKYGLVLAVFFGGFQALMPLLGWLLGSRFQQYIMNIDHWVAFVLLLILGAKMIIEAVREEDEVVCQRDHMIFDFKEIFMLAVATSIDALAVGITFAFLQVKILPAVSLIGCITFGFSIGGVFIGNVFGRRFKKPAAVVGGLILIWIGAKILLEHLGILS